MKYFIYYSATGNGDYLASLLKEKGYTPIKVQMEKEIGKMNFFKILKYGFKAMKNSKAKILPLDLSLKEEDEVIIGSPIWNDRLSTPINTVLSLYELNKEGTFFIFYPAGEGTKKSLEQIKKMGFNKEAVVISNPLKNQEKAKGMIQEI